MNKNTIADVLNTIATDIRNGSYNPKSELFDWEATGQILFGSGENTVTTNVEVDYDALNAFFHETIGKPPRCLTLNHALNKVNMDWKMKNLRTPKGWRALVEVAADMKLNTKELCEAIMLNPRFNKNAIGEAAREYLDTQV